MVIICHWKPFLETTKTGIIKPTSSGNRVIHCVFTDVVHIKTWMYLHLFEHVGEKFYHWVIWNDHVTGVQSGIYSWPERVHLHSPALASLTSWTSAIHKKTIRLKTQLQNTFDYDVFTITKALSVYVQYVCPTWLHCSTNISVYWHCQND